MLAGRLFENPAVPLREGGMSIPAALTVSSQSAALAGLRSAGCLSGGDCPHENSLKETGGALRHAGVALLADTRAKYVREADLSGA